MASTSMNGRIGTLTIGGVAVGQAKSAQFSGSKWATDDITNMASPTAGVGVIKEQAPTILTPGELAIGGVWLYNDPGKQALITAFNTGALVAVVLTLVKGEAQATAGTSFTFSGYVTDPPYPDMSVDKAMTFKATILANTAITVGYGS